MEICEIYYKILSSWDLEGEIEIKFLFIYFILVIIDWFVFNVSYCLILICLGLFFVGEINFLVFCGDRIR